MDHCKLEDVREAKLVFASTYMKPRSVHGVGIRRSDDGGLCLVVSGTAKGLAAMPEEFMGIPVVRHQASMSRVALAGN